MKQELLLFSKSTSDSRIGTLQTAQRGITPLGQSANWQCATQIRFLNFEIEIAQNRNGTSCSKQFSGVAGFLSFTIMYLSKLAIAFLASWR